MTIPLRLRAGPLSAPGYARKVAARYFTRISRRGGNRQLFFVPGAVLKVGLNATERRLLAEEWERTSEAARHPFWAGLPATSVPVLGAGFVGWRYRQARLDDFPEIKRLIEQRLEACRPLPRRPMADAIERASPAVGELGADDRARLADLLAEFTVPVSSMHGDLHFFNFVRSDDGFRVIDWEHFDEGGSFVFDYVDFHVAIDFLNGSRSWPDTLAAVSPDHPAVRRGAEVSGATPRAVRAYFLLGKVATILSRRQIANAVVPVERDGLVAALRNAISSVAPIFA
jgi:hypothetical protein